MKNETIKQSPLLVIASYPPKGEKHSKAIVGGAMYAKNTLEAVLKAAREDGNKKEILVLAETLKESGNKKETYDDEGIVVDRFWRRNSFTSYFQLAKKISRYPKSPTVVIEFELVMFGDAPSLLLLPFFLLYLRIIGKHIVFVFHQVLSDIAEMSGHLNLPQKSLKTTLLNYVYKTLYTILLTCSSEAIVFEEVLKKRLHKLNKNKKVTVIPFGTEIFSAIPSKQQARSLLNIPTDAFIVFSFGFIAWYKGTDWLVENWRSIHQSGDTKLIIGGGPNPNHLNKPFYQSFIENINKKSTEKGITITGFIEEEKMPLYFQASDLIILPYRTLMSSSGPLSLAFSFEKPVLLSSPMESLLQTPDLAESLSEVDLKKDELIFALDSTFLERIEQLSTDKTLLAKLAKLSANIGKKRSWDAVGKTYYQLFFR